MSTVFVKSAYDQLYIILHTISTIINIGLLDKFTLRIFNKLVYYQEISNFFIASVFLGLSKYYIIPRDIKSINLRLFHSCFYKFVLNEYNQTRNGNNIVIL